MINEIIFTLELEKWRETFDFLESTSRRRAQKSGLSDLKLSPYGQIAISHTQKCQFREIYISSKTSVRLRPKR